MKRDAEERLGKVTISPDLSIGNALAILDMSGIGVLLLCEDSRKLIGVLTDGDIRRALLRQVAFDQPCHTIASKDPVIAEGPVTISEALYLMDHGKSFVVNHLPVINAEGQVIDLLLRRDLIGEEPPEVSAVVMAGGFGTRLRPLTEDTPKPMLPIGDRPLLELIIKRLREAGIREVSVTTHYLPEQIIKHFGDGKEFGVDISYVTEDTPLGTAGALGLLATPSQTLLVMNGDILTQVDFRAMLAFHRQHQADLTVGVRRFDLQVQYGVITSEGPYVRDVQEKPVVRHLVNAGIYLLEPVAHRYIPSGEFFDMPDLMRCLIDKGRSVVSFPIVEYWLDVGQVKDYEQAQDDMRRGRVSA